jgi:hypothetical protein
MESNRTPLIIGLVILITAVVGFLIYQAKGQASLSESQQKLIQATQQGPPGTFTPAPR